MAAQHHFDSSCRCKTKSRTTAPPRPAPPRPTPEELSVLAPCGSTLSFIARSRSCRVKGRPGAPAEYGPRRRRNLPPDDCLSTTRSLERVDRVSVKLAQKGLRHVR